MESWGLPSDLHNLVNMLQNNLPIAYLERFSAEIERRLENLPDSWEVARSQGMNTSGAIEGTDFISYLTPISYWIAFTFLVDSELGMLPHVQSPVDRECIRKVHALYLRWFSGDIPSEEEWNAAGEAEGASDDFGSLIHSATWVGHFPVGLEFFGVEMATLYEGKSVPAWGTKAIGPPEGLFTALRKWPIRQLARLMVLKPNGGNRKYYLAEANLLLRLLDLRWYADEEEERKVFQSILGGNLEALTRYGKMLSDAGVPAEAAAAMADTLRKLVALRKAF